jgi:hypothetical protein
MSPDITKGLKGLGIGPGASANTSSGSGGGDGGIVVSGYRPTSISTSLGGSPNKIQQALNQKTEVPYDGITAIGNRVGSTFGVDIGGNRFGTPGQDKSAFEKMYEEPYDPNEILVKATTTTTPVSVTDPGLAERLAEMENYAEKPLIKVTGNKTEPTSVSADLGLGTGSVTDKLPVDPTLTDKKKLGVEDYLRLAGLATGLVGNLTGGGGKGGSGGSGTYIPGGAGSGRLNPIFSAQLPATGGLGTIGTTRTARPLGDQDWLTYGTRPELKFFDYSTTPANPAPVTTPVPGNPAGPIMTTPAAGMIPAPDQKLTPAQLADLERQSLAQTAYLSQFAGPTAEELARNTALYSTTGEPIMEEPTRMMAKGGAFAAKRGGPSKRTEFAVNGSGTGRSDEIPAVLSDGEYVIDAETVALLGDGSSKAGAKKLDELRVKVRKHKGKKLAKGRFSANAKKPEAYLSGGRI